MTAGVTPVHALESKDHSKLLELIDDYRTLGISKEVSLPQLVVVGSQSSGKSSLLEGITGFSLPTDSGLCTRFATQLILRKCETGEECMEVSIIPDPNANYADEWLEHLKLFTQKVAGGDLNEQSVVQVVDDATEHLGLPLRKSKWDQQAQALEDEAVIPDAQSPDTPVEIEIEADDDEQQNWIGAGFTNDVLRIVLYKPSYPQLTIVDVPGVLVAETPGQTKEDIAFVNNMVKSYIGEKRTIILAVMDGLSNFANQGGFQFAKEAPNGMQRTVGVITKADVVPAGTEDEVLETARNRRQKLRHGWYLVKNRSAKEAHGPGAISIAARNINEAEFFRKTHPWTLLDHQRLGTPALTKALSKLLHDHVKSEFPQLLNEIRSKVEYARKLVDSLGSRRDDAHTQRRYLIDIAAEFERQVAIATVGSYPGNWAPADSRKLRMLTARENARFAAEMAQRGHTREFLHADGTVDEDDYPGSYMNATSVTAPLAQATSITHSVVQAQSQAIADSIIAATSSPTKTPFVSTALTSGFTFARPSAVRTASQLAAHATPAVSASASQSDDPGVFARAIMELHQDPIGEQKAPDANRVRWDAERAQKAEIDRAYDWIRTAYRESRGSELPGSGVNPALLESLFRQQAAPWVSISREFISRIDNLVVQFYSSSLEQLVNDADVRQRLMARFDKAAAATRSDAGARLDDLLDAELSDILLTENNYFAENLRHLSEARLLHRYEEQELEEGKEESLQDKIKRFALAQHSHNEEQAVFGIHDILSAYYKVARKRFVDYTLKLVAERCYLGQRGLVRFLNAKYVGGLSDYELAEIAGEDEDLSERRREAERELERLQEALKRGDAI